MLSDAPQNLVPRLLALHGLLLEWIDTADHFIEEHAETPPIDGEAVTVGFDHLGSEVLRRSTEGIGLPIYRLLDFAEAEVSQLEVPLGVKKDIFWLQVTVDDAIGVEMLQSKHHLCCIEARSILCKADLVAQMEEQFSTVEEISDEVKIL